MRVTNLKLLRDLWRMRGQVLAIAAVIAAATATFVLSVGVHGSVSDTREIYYERNNFADVFATMTRAPRSMVDRVEEIDGVRQAEGRIVQYVTLEIAGRIDPIRAVLNSIEAGGASDLNQLVIVEGRGPANDESSEVVVDKAFADANDLGPGDAIDALIYGTRERLEIVGIGLAPDYIWSIAPGELIPDESRFGIFWMGRRALEGATDRTEAINEISLTLDQGEYEADVIRQLDTILTPYGGTGAYGREYHVSHAFLDNELMQLDAMTRIIPPVFLIVSTFLVYVVLGRMILTEREQIGLLKAFGYSNVRIAWHYIKFAFAIAIIGIILGSLAGAWMGRSLTELYAQYYRFPFLSYTLSPQTFTIAALLAFGSAGFGALGGVRQAIGLTPAVAMSPPPPAIYRPGLIEKLGRIGGFTSIGRMIARHITRWPGRSSMTVAGVALSLGLLFSVMQFIDSSEDMLESYFFRAQRQDITVTFIEPRNEDVLYELARLDGVLRVEPVRSVAVRIRHGHLTERAAIESAQSNSHLWARIDSEENEITLPPAGLMLSRQLADKLDADIGDEIEVTLLQGRRTVSTVTVTSTIDELVGTSAYAESNTLDRLTRDRTPVTAALLRIDSARRADILDTLRDMPIVLGVTERDAALDRFAEVIDENIITMIGFYVLFASAIAVGVVYNSARILFSERARELATLRVLGYHESEVGVVLLGELALLIAIAVPVGCLTGYWLAQLMTTLFSSDLFRLPFSPNRSTYGFSILVVLFASALTAMIVARRVMRLDMVRVLKARD